MSGAEIPEPGRLRDPVSAVLPHLSAPEDTIRCAAARALGALADERAAPALVDALLDEDPDVRTDAMDALCLCARSEDAEAVLRSLEGDPVKEVKLAAIATLQRLGDRRALPLITGLASDKCSDAVAWEDDDGLWDDWLDVQIAAIAALGTFDAADAIDALLAARTDEMGQDIDHAVFAALAQMSGKGIVTLIDLVTTHEGRVRARALAALAKASGDLLRPLAPVLAEDASADVRRLAIPHLDPAHDLASALALTDPDPATRREALAGFAPQRPDLAEAALADPDETVRALALDALPLPDEASARDDLLANIAAWLAVAGPRLATACVAALERAGGTAVADQLGDVAADAARPVEARVAAIAALGRMDRAELIEWLEHCAHDDVQQIRAAALAALAVRADRDPAAMTVLSKIILSAVTAPPADRDTDGAEEPETAAADRVEEGPARLHITPEGDVVDAADALPETGETAEIIPFPTSTLASMGAWKPDQPPLEETEDSTPDIAPGDSPARMTPRRRRVAVAGPSETTIDQPLVAIRIATGLAGAEIDAALAAVTESPNPTLRGAAMSALGARLRDGTGSPDVVEALRTGLADTEAHVRGFAATALAEASDLPDLDAVLRPFIDDADAIVRAAAVTAVGLRDPLAVLAKVGDPSPRVRLAALSAVTASQSDDVISTAVQNALEAQAVDTLAAVSRTSDAVLDAILRVVGHQGTPRKFVLATLEALAAR